ncbi:MucB/RseB C-terminal domain-containing protein [Alcanivorax sp. JB21]|uniref:MucB/RseB C-terminal domain-containing protein n=1 Tax=Alcanivorax limicola TaxID=2874102 RepID=UPI001CBAEBB0|nr:MucB/RseB C-terminal domain-containing protein [Alcanivorax limicola]MBZ2189831.1 MucB/RseB C-terminal domain-containing protein [Alcanivorax limicola]
MTLMLRRAALLLMMFPVLALAEGSQPQSLLTAMAEAYRSLDYQGRFLYMYGNQLSTMKVRHAVIDGREYERLTHLDGPLAELIRQDDDVICVHPDRSITRLRAEEGLGPMQFQARISQALPAQYNVLLDGDDRVAGREASRVRIAALDNHRHGYRLWIDQDSNLLLKSEMVDARGVVLERIEFVTLDIDPALTVDDFAAPAAAVVHAIEDVAPEAHPQGRLELDMTWLPEGFEVLEKDLRRNTPDRDPVAALAYSDGLATFTLFVENLPEGRSAEEGVSRMGPTVAVSRLFGGTDETAARYLVTLVGEIPQDTAERVLAAARIGGSQ